MPAGSASPIITNRVERRRALAHLCALSLIDVARRFRLGQQALRLANPSLPRWLPLSGRAVVLPTRHVLPAAPRAAGAVPAVD